MASCFGGGISYERWVKKFDTLTAADCAKIRSHIAIMAYRPLISVVMPVFETPEWALKEAIESVKGQIYENWELCVADDASESRHVADVLRAKAREDGRIRWLRREKNGNISAASNSALAIASGEFVALMDHDDVLSADALYEVVAALNENRELDIIYSDEDQIDRKRRRHTPHFKTDWNIDLLLGCNMISHLGVYRRSLIERVGGFREGFEGSQDHDLALRCSALTSAERIHHIPAILYHWRRDYGPSSFSERHLRACADASRRAIVEHLVRRNESGVVAPHPMLPGFIRVSRAVPAEAPLVSLVIPTRDRADLLERCVDGILHRTDYRNIEVLIADNESMEAETLSLFARLANDARVKIISCPGVFNYSAINNLVVSRSKAPIVGLINNDVDVIDAGWLSEMVSLVVLPDVGVVGAKLLYPNNRVQHAGVVLGVGGVAAHMGLGLPRDAGGYFGRNLMRSAASAVTGACLLVRRSVYHEVGGLDEENLPVAFNDIDFCMKVLARGYRNVWTPHAELYHYESASRGPDTEGEKVVRFRKEVEFMSKKWGDRLMRDRFYNENLSLDAGRIFQPGVPRRRKGWR